jgi:hypothetical protein
MEIISGIVLVGLGIALWGIGWWHWVLVGLGLLGVSPWLGVRRILRRAERDPSVLVSDPERRRARARRTAPVTAAVQTVVCAGVGYALDGWPAALYVGGLGALGSAMGVWWTLRRFRA